MLSIGIVGLPNVGKSTLFKALTKKEIEIANYPFATIDPNVGVVTVSDERLKKLAEISKSAQIIPTAIEFVDIAGLVEGANKGEGLGNQFLHNIREVDAILYVTRVFVGSDIQHIIGSIDPKRDLEIVKNELALKDLETLERRIDKVDGEARSGDKELQRELEILQKFQQILDSGKHIIESLGNKGLPSDSIKRPSGGLLVGESKEERMLLKELQLLTAKPAIYLFNTKGQTPNVKENTILVPGTKIVSMNVREELDTADLNGKERKELGLGESKLIQLIQKAYEALDLVTFFTTGEQETRAWTTEAGSKAPQAAGVIHTDFEHGFIRAEVIGWRLLVQTGSWSRARENGLIRIEGKEYVFQDGDVTHFLHKI